MLLVLSGLGLMIGYPDWLELSILVGLPVIGLLLALASVGVAASTFRNGFQKIALLIVVLALVEAVWYAYAATVSLSTISLPRLL